MWVVGQVGLHMCTCGWLALSQAVVLTFDPFPREMPLPTVPTRELCSSSSFY